MIIEITDNHIGVSQKSASLEKPTQHGWWLRKAETRAFAVQLPDTSPKGFPFPFAIFTAPLTSGQSLVTPKFLVSS